MVFHLIGSDGAGLQQFLHQAVVAGDLAHRAGAQQIGAGIPGPQAGEMLAARHHHHDGRGHHDVGAATRRLLTQRDMRPLDCQAHLRQEFRRRQLGRNCLQSFRDHAGGHFAGGMSTSAVRHRPKAEIGPIDVCVLVVRPSGARMCHGPGTETRGGHDDGSHVVSPGTCCSVLPEAASIPSIAA